MSEHKEFLLMLGAAFVLAVLSLFVYGQIVETPRPDPTPSQPCRCGESCPCWEWDYSK